MRDPPPVLNDTSSIDANVSTNDDILDTIFAYANVVNDRGDDFVASLIFVKIGYNCIFFYYCCARLYTSS